MSNVVLGFRKEDVSGFTFLSPHGGKAVYTIPEDKLVPVRLKSESVSIKWLENLCREMHETFGWSSIEAAGDWSILRKILLSAAKSEAGAK